MTNINTAKFNGTIKQRKTSFIIIGFIVSFLSGYFHNYYIQINRK